MTDELVTVATFDTPTAAGFMRSQLEAEGIRVYTANEEVVGLAWHLGNAVGGIKLQVVEDDAQRAISILEEVEDDTPITSEEWQREEFDDSVGAGVADEEDARREAPIDELARRALRSALFGLLILPLQLYSLWLLVQIARENVPLGSSNQRRMLMAGVLDMYVVVVGILFLHFVFS
ncbi:MAG: hypothetical protein ACOC0A_00545 [Planctomycetota bacterium]